MKRVLQIFGRFGRGGLESLVMNLYKAIDREQIQFDFLLTSPNGENEAEAKSLGARIFYIPSRSGGIQQYKNALDSFFANHAAEYCAVHLHVSSLSSIDPLVYAKKYNIPVRIIHSHSSSVKRNLRARGFHYLMHMLHKPLVHSVATHYLGCSDKALDWLYDWTGVRSKARMINNGIETSKYVYNQTERINVRRELNIPMDAKVVGHVGSLIHVKNHEFLIRLFSEITKEIPESILLLVGEGELRNKLEALVAELRIQNNVIFTGSRSDVNRILQAMDLFVMPSFFEGLPVSLVEAQASGLPILASDTISKDVAITPNIKFISLNADIHVWTDAVKQQLFHFNRCDTSNMICNSGFDISGIANTLSTMYLSSYE